MSRLGPWISVVSDHERSGAGRVSRDSGPWFPMDSDHEQQAWEGVTASPIVSAMGLIRLRGHERQGLRGYHALGFVVSHGLRP